MKTDYNYGPTLEARLRANIGAPDENGCMNWLLSVNCRYGYGQIMDWVDGKHRLRRPHMVAWVLANGPIPEGLDVCHTCDNRRCCNLEHLWLGTRAENLADMKAKGRAPRGERSGNAKVTEEDVRDIRRRVAAGEQQKRLAAEYGLTSGGLCQIVKRHTWAHVV